MAILLEPLRYVAVTLMMVALGANAIPVLAQHGVFTAVDQPEHTCVKRGETRYRC